MHEALSLLSAELPREARLDHDALATKKREVLQLLKDWRAFFSPFGGAAAADSTLNLEAAGAFGPAGLIFSGTEFEGEDRKAIRRSFRALVAPLVRLQEEEKVGKHSEGDPITGAKAYITFIEPYFADPADPSIVADRRKKAAKGNMVARRFTEAHDAGVEWLALDLWDVELHSVFPRLMSEKEEAEIEHQNSEMYAVFQRLRVSGLTIDAALSQTAENFGLRDISYIERVIEFRSATKPDTCTWGGCDRAPFSQDLCMKHYQQKRRAAKKRTESA